jgi:thiamine-phosphate pyrophosphorylase
MYKYLITSNDFYSRDIEIFCKTLSNQIEKHRPEYALFRDKENINYKIQAAHFVRVCSGYKNLKSFIHQDAGLAKELGASGVHLTSMQFEEIAKAKDFGLQVIVSTHFKEEILRAKDLGADAVTYSPIFHSPNKGEPKGVENLKEILKACDIDIFALGGIVTNEHIKALQETNVYGFASIRYFY